MRKIVTLCLTLVLGVLVAQNSLNPSQYDLKKINKSFGLDAKSFVEARKQKNVSRDFPGNIWVGFSSAFDLYASNSGGDNYTWSFLWEDSSAVYAYDDNGTPNSFHWWIHSFGEVFDPNTEIYGAAYNAEEWFDGEKSYVVDSLAIPYAYVRNVDSTMDTSGIMHEVIDTLIINVIKNSSIMAGQFTSGTPAPLVGYDYTSNEPSGSTDRYVVTLGSTDTSSFGINHIIDMNQFELGKGERLGVTVNFKSGTTWDFGDTLAIGSGTNAPSQYAGNRIFFLMYEEVVDDLPISHQIDDHNSYNQGLFVASDLRYNDAGSWNGSYIPSFAYSSPTFYWEHLVMDLKLTPYGVDFFYNKNGLTVDFFDNSNFSPTSWKWEFNDGTGNQMGGQNVTYTFPQPGSYNVCLEANNGSDYYSACQTVNVDFGIGINEVENTLEVKVYPNPTSKNLNINLNASTNDALSITLFDVLGNEVYNNEILSTNQFNGTISLDGLSNGLYILKVKHGEQLINQNINVIK